MENTQNQENKITIWWKKTLLILGVYIVWWFVFYGSWFLIPQDFFRERGEPFDTNMSYIIWFLILIVFPITSFLIPRYLVKKVDTSFKKLKIFNWFLLIIGLIFFYVLGIYVALSHWGASL